MDTKAEHRAISGRMLAGLPRRHPLPELERFYALLRDYPERGGKLLRGRMLLRATAAHGAPAERGLDAAAALELFQNWVLIHDDVEDDSDERRGRPALHKRVGVPLAVNAGDALHVYMWQRLFEAELPADAVRQAQREFVEMIHRTAEGQHLDLSWVAQRRFDVTEAEYLTMVELKTAHYTVVAPLRLGAICAGRTPRPEFDRLGRDLGAAFQIRDDVLNLMTDVGGYGKEHAGDLLEGKRTLILAHLFAHAGADERAELGARLGKPRRDKRPDDVARVLALVERYGSLRYAQGVAEALADAALGELRALLDELPGRRAAAALTELLESLALRRR